MTQLNVTSGLLSDRPLPANPDAERTILGAILLDSERFQDVAAADLQPDQLTLDSHRKIFRGMLALSEQGLAIDMITLAEVLSRSKELEAIGGVAYLASLVDGVPRRPSIREYVKIVQDKATLRQLIHAANNTYLTATDPTATVEMALASAEAITTVPLPGLINSIADVPDIFEREIPDLRWVVPDLILEGGVTLISAPPKAGKSVFVLALARNIALGLPFLGRETLRKEVIYVDKEMPAALARSRASSINGGPIPSLRYWDRGAKHRPPMIDSATYRQLARTKPVIIFDALKRFHGADENSASEMSVELERFRQLADLGATVVIVHHTGKDLEKGYRGSTDIPAAVDMALTLELLSNTPEGNATLRLASKYSRATGSCDITLQGNLARGEFEVSGSDQPQDARQIALANTFTSIINSVQGGITQNALFTEARNKSTGFNNAAAVDLLHRLDGTHWRTEKRGKAIYYLSIASTSASTGATYCASESTAAPTPHRAADFAFGHNATTGEEEDAG